MTGVLLVTGGSRGIGAATARLAAERGYAVAVNYRARRDAADAVVSAITEAGGTARAFACDVADEGAIERLFAEVEAALGTPTALVNNAGISAKSATADLSGETLTRLLAVNVIGTMLCCREAVRRMSTARGGPGGAIVNVSSMAATTGGRTSSGAYAASKAAVDVFTLGLAKEVGAEGIRANVVRPGMTETDMTVGVHENPERRAEIAASIPMNRIATPDEIARPILWLLSDEASFVSGCFIEASGGGFHIGRPGG